MRGSNGTNPAAGRRFLGARSHARLLDEQSEVLAIAVRADERVIQMARLVASVHNDLRAIESHAQSANRRASDATYEAPTSMGLLVAA